MVDLGTVSARDPVCGQSVTNRDRILGQCFEVREFDLSTGQFVTGGFHLPRGKHRNSGKADLLAELGTAAASLGAKQLRELIKAARALEPAAT